MCKLKSAIVLKDRIFMPDYDSHDRMLEELDIEDNYLNASKKFVRVELSPKNGDVFTNIDEWELDVDQDVKPDWFDRDEAKDRMRKQVKEWAKTHLFYNVDGLDICSGENIYIKDCENVNIYGNAIISNIYGNSQINCIHGNAIVNFISGNAKVNDIYGKATIDYICNNVMISNIYGNAIVGHIHGNATVNFISGNAIVGYIHGNATIDYICNNVMISNIYGNAIVGYIHGNATVKESTFDSWKNINNVSLRDNAILISYFQKTIYTAREYKVQKYNVDDYKE